MSGRDQEQSDLQMARREGLAWVDLLISGHATQDDAEALRRWRDLGALQAQAFEEAMRLRRATQILAEEVRMTTQTPKSTAKERFSRRMLIGGALAAGVGGLLVVRPPAGLWPSYAELTADVRTGAGEQQRLSLAPGVSVDMNTRTSVERIAGSSGYGLKLISGEAMLMSRQATGVAYIAARGVRVSALGDADFSVRLLSTSICITCVHGAVEVKGPGGALGFSEGRQVIHGQRGFGSIQPVDAATVTAWRRGYVIFRNTPLSTVVGEINRYRVGRIVLANGYLKDRPVYGAFRTTHTDAVIRQIEALSGARVTRLPGGMVVLT